MTSLTVIIPIALENRNFGIFTFRFKYSFSNSRIDNPYTKNIYIDVTPINFRFPCSTASHVAVKHTYIKTKT